MEAVQEIIKEMNPSTNSHSDDISDLFCSICGKQKKMKTIEILGMTKTFPVPCVCEIEQSKNQKSEWEKDRWLFDYKSIYFFANPGTRFKETTFDNFLKREGSEKAFQVAKNYAHQFKEVDYGLLIWGEPGNGKTHLAAAINNYLFDQMIESVFVSVPELLETIRNTFRGEDKHSEEKIMKALIRCDLLVLDDIGAEKLSDWVQDVMFRIIDGRYKNNKKMVFTSNLKPSELGERLGHRAIDRIIETCLIIENKATSYRREIATKRFKEMGI